LEIEKFITCFLLARNSVAYMLSALYVIARPSVRLSVTRVYHTKTVILS